MSSKLSEYRKLVADVKAHNCSLRAGCIQAVPGEGDPESPLVFIGEAPGKTEDELGRPFVGAAGKLLEEGLQLLGMSRDQVYITNIVKCRPPANRDPSSSEVAEHKVFLERELELIRPKLIVLLGRHSLQWFLPDEKISEMRGTAKRVGNRVFFASYHPAAALYDPRLKDTLFSDFKKIPILLNKLEELPPIASTPPQQDVLL